VKSDAPTGTAQHRAVGVALIGMAAFLLAWRRCCGGARIRGVPSCRQTSGDVSTGTGEVAV
jgi:hypothetical protein